MNFRKLFSVAVVVSAIAFLYSYTKDFRPLVYTLAESTFA